MLKITLAMMLVSAPINAIEDIPNPEDWPEISMRLKQVCIEQDLISYGNITSYFHTPKEFNIDLKIVRNNYINLKDAPKLHEEQLFNCFYNDITESINFNEKHTAYLEKLLELEYYRQEDLIPIIKENKEILHLLYIVRSFKNENYTNYSRRMSLKEYKEAVGEKDYYDGWVPFPVCMDSFRENK